MVHVRFGILGAVLALALMASTCAYAIPYVQTYAITTSAQSADNPAIWGNYAVWQATGTSGTDIFAAVLTGGSINTSQIMTVCSATGSQSNPTVGQNFIAWEDKRSDSQGDLYAASANWSTGAFSEFRVSGKTGAEINAAICGNIVTYNYNNGSYTVQAYDMAAKTAQPVVASGSAQKGAPVISDGYILWQDARAGTSNYDVWGLERADSDTFVAVNGSGSQINPAIWNTTIAWNVLSSGFYKIGFKDLAGGSAAYIPNGAFDMLNPSISGDYIVWQDKRSGDWDVYAYQISTGATFVVAGGAGDQDKPQIYGDMVVYRDLNGSSSQVMYAVFSATAPAETPEPGSILALITGILGAVGYSRRKRSG